MHAIDHIYIIIILLSYIYIYIYIYYLHYWYRIDLHNLKSQWKIYIYAQTMFLLHLTKEMNNF